MTDDAEQYWNAWVGIYGPNTTKQLLCKWHIDRAWRKALQEHIANKEDKIRIYHFLQVLLSDFEKSTFTVTLQQFLSITADTYPSFHHYFLKNYCSHTEEWATCYRKWAFINTNMFTESFHNVLKTVYQDNKHNRRLDHLASVLLKIARDKAFGCFQKLQKGKATHRVTEMNKRHRTAEKMTTTMKRLQQDI